MTEGRIKREQGVRRIAVGTLFALAMRTILACNDDYDDFRADVVLCEEAVARIADCCGTEEAAGLRCAYYHEEEGCTSDGARPDFDEDESRGILDWSCASIRAWRRELRERASQ